MLGFFLTSSSQSKSNEASSSSAIEKRDFCVTTLALLAFPNAKLFLLLGLLTCTFSNGLWLSLLVSFLMVSNFDWGRDAKENVDSLANVVERTFPVLGPPSFSSPSLFFTVGGDDTASKLTSERIVALPLISFPKAWLCCSSLPLLSTDRFSKLFFPKRVNVILHFSGGQHSSGSCSPWSCSPGLKIVSFWKREHSSFFFSEEWSSFVLGLKENLASLAAGGLSLSRISGSWELTTFVSFTTWPLLCFLMEIVAAFAATDTLSFSSPRTESASLERSERPDAGNTEGRAFASGSCVLVKNPRDFFVCSLCQLLDTRCVITESCTLALGDAGSWIFASEEKQLSSSGLFLLILETLSCSKEACRFKVVSDSLIPFPFLGIEALLSSEQDVLHRVFEANLFGDILGTGNFFWKVSSASVLLSSRLSNHARLPSSPLLLCFIKCFVFLLLPCAGLHKGSRCISSSQALSGKEGCGLELSSCWFEGSDWDICFDCPNASLFKHLVVVLKLVSSGCSWHEFSFCNLWNEKKIGNSNLFFFFFSFFIALAMLNMYELWKATNNVGHKTALLSFTYSSESWWCSLWSFSSFHSKWKNLVSPVEDRQMDRESNHVNLISLGNQTDIPPPPPTALQYLHPLLESLRHIYSVSISSRKGTSLDFILTKAKPQTSYQNGKSKYYLE